MAWLDDIEPYIDDLARGVRPMPDRWPADLLEGAPADAVNVAARALQRPASTTAGRLGAWRLLYAELLARRGDPEPLTYELWRRDGAPGLPGPWRRTAHAFYRQPGPGAWRHLVRSTPGDTHLHRLRRVTRRVLSDGIDHRTLGALLGQGEHPAPALPPPGAWPDQGPPPRRAPASPGRASVA